MLFSLLYQVHITELNNLFQIVFKIADYFLTVNVTRSSAEIDKEYSRLESILLILVNFCETLSAKVNLTVVSGGILFNLLCISIS